MDDGAATEGENGEFCSAMVRFWVLACLGKKRENFASRWPDFGVWGILDMQVRMTEGSRGPIGVGIVARGRKEEIPDPMVRFRILECLLTWLKTMFWLHEPEVAC
jgi:hypothetical protein